MIILGEGREKGNLEKLVQELKIQDKVIFGGWTNDLEQYYKSADVYVSTSFYEGYGMAIVEGALMGLPLIISNAGVAGELFKEGQEAFILEPKDTKGFANTMAELAQDENLRKRMGNQAKVIAEKNLISKEEYLQKYKQAIYIAASSLKERKNIFQKNIILRYLISGITAASTNIILLYIFTDILHIWYLYSSALSFILAISE